MPENKAVLLMVPSDLNYYFAVFLLTDSVHVCLSWALPQAFAFWTILFLIAFVGAYSYNKSVTYLLY